MEDVTYNLKDTANIINGFVENGVLGREVLNCLIVKNQIIPKEGWLWDFKEDLPKDKLSLGKSIRSIISFYNMLGGYLIYGVKETEKDATFMFSDVDHNSFSLSQFRDQILNYTGEVVDISAKNITINDHNNISHSICLLHVPKRPTRKAPIKFIKNGPEKKAGKNIFLANDVYFRQLDQCLPAKTPDDWKALYSDRAAYLVAGIDDIKFTKTEILDNNLPDRGLICPKFVGRQVEITKLWEWLSDPFEYVKILAGDGGKGKTSIAYEFCVEFLTNPPIGYHKVLWISAKEKQFSGIENSEYELSPADFSDNESFLHTLCHNLALQEDEYQDLPSDFIKRKLYEALKIFPMLIVVDNIDSVEDDNQKKIVDSCRQLGQDKARFIVTTRKKFAYSSDICIEIRGLKEEEYKDYIDSLTKRFNLTRIPKNKVHFLRKATDGSPLLTESILRFARLGEPLDTAVQVWKGKAGEDARSAALEKEISGLSPDAKRVLVAAVYFSSCSTTELKQSVEMEKLQYLDAIEELRSLFLLDAPKIIGAEDRFSVSTTTSLLVENMASKLAYDFKKLKLKIKSLRSGISFQKKEGNRKRIGQAISQANAFLREDKIKLALETIESELNTQRNHPDLLLAKGRYLLKKQNPPIDEIRTILHNSYNKGQRKPLIFDLWYEAESKADYPTGMIEVASKALDADIGNTAEWSYKLATAFTVRGIRRNRDDNTIDAIDDLNSANIYLQKAIDSSNGIYRRSRIDDSHMLHDVIWDISTTSMYIPWLSSFDVILKDIKNGDIRTVLYIRAVQCLEEAQKEFTNNPSEKYQSAIELRIQQINNSFGSRGSKDKADRPFDDLIERLNTVFGNIQHISN